MSSLYVNDAKASIRCDGDIVASGFKIAKDPNRFYMYKLLVLDLKFSDGPRKDRLLLDINGTVELGPKDVLRDYILLKHGAEINALGVDPAYLTFDVSVIKNFAVEE